MKARSYNVMEKGKQCSEIHKKKNRKEKKIKMGMLDGTNTSKLHTLNNKSIGRYIIHQTKICNTENTNKLTLASCTHNMQYFHGCHPVDSV
jgi:heterodisulfide reductase subunit C